MKETCDDEMRQRLARFTRSISRAIRSRSLSGWLLWIAWIGLLAVLCVRGLKNGPTFDFGIFRDAAAAAAEGAALYEGSADGRSLYLYGPIFAVFMRPLLILPVEAAYVVWVLASVVAVAASAWVTDRALRALLGRPISGWILLAAMSILISPLMSNFRHGNSNAFLMLLIAIGFWGVVASAPRAAGAALALAAALKLAPMLFLVWLLVRRSWRASASFLVGLAVWLVVVPVIAQGPRYAVDETLAWSDQVIIPGIVAPGERPQIIQAAGHSLTRAVESLLGTETEADRRPSLEILGPQLAHRVAGALGALVLVASLALAWREIGSGAVGFGVISAAMLLAAPLSRSDHFMVLYPFVALLLALAVGGDPPADRTSRWGLAIALAVALLLLMAAAVTGFPSNAFYPLTGLTLALWITGLRLLTSRQMLGTSSAAPDPAAL